MLPEYFRLRLLFISDFTRSPKVPVTTNIKAIMIQCTALISVKNNEVRYETSNF
jgi:hypothetical protein